MNKKKVVNILWHILIGSVLVLATVGVFQMVAEWGSKYELIVQPPIKIERQRVVIIRERDYITPLVELVDRFVEAQGEVEPEIAEITVNESKSLNTIMSQKLKLLGFGEVLWDKINGNLNIGGTVFNLVAHCKKMGSDSYLISSIGNDKLGKKTISIIQKGPAV